MRKDRHAEPELGGVLSVAQAEHEPPIVDEEPVAGGLGLRPRPEQALAPELGCRRVEEHSQLEVRVRAQLPVGIVHLHVRADRTTKRARRVVVVDLGGLLLLEKAR